VAGEQSKIRSSLLLALDKRENQVQYRTRAGGAM